MRHELEWPTLAVAVAIYAGFGLLTWHFHQLPWWVVAPLGGYVVAWHGSLQHEVVHGHPTPWRWVNRALVFPSLWLWIPFEIYADSHLRHHRAELAHPGEDPESFYLSRRDWDRASASARGLLTACNTSAGRLLLGPFVQTWRFAREQLRDLRRGERRHVRAWLVHGVSCAAVLGWTAGVCGISVPAYLLLFVYPGVSLTLLRSFAEHRAQGTNPERSAIVEAGPLMGLLYLNNNLHAVHHAEPDLPWYALPGRWRDRREAILAANGHYRFRGYAEVIARYLIRPREPVAFPLHGGEQIVLAGHALAADAPVPPPRARPVSAVPQALGGAPPSAFRRATKASSSSFTAGSSGGDA